MSQSSTQSSTSYTRPLLLSWPEAFQLYLHDPHAKKMLRRFAYRFFPIATGIAFIDDFVLPGVGFIDDATLPFLIAGLLVMLYKVNKYRHHPPAMRSIE
jgi:hypothetical protein